MTPDALFSLFDTGQQALFEAVVQPLLYALGAANLLEDAFEATGWLLVGLLQLAVMLVVIAPLQRWRPVEPHAGEDRALVRVDVFYTLLHRLGAFRLLLFFAVDPLWDALFGTLGVHGYVGWQLDQAAARLVAPFAPALANSALAAFVLYLVVFDFADYWIHRAQHGSSAWWALHSLHHSQRRMTMWSDSRNHLLDDLLRDGLLVVLAQAIGVAPGQFIGIVALTQLIENLQHANARLHFGALGERLLVSPRFHRLHHGVGIGHESAGRGTLGGHNFAVLLPVWDVLFGTARFDAHYESTGVRGSDEAAATREDDIGFLGQQLAGLRRLGACIGPRRAAGTRAAREPA